MAKTWRKVRVELLSGVTTECDPAPGRVFLVGPRHTFQQLARAINLAFARWDLSHLYAFELADGSRVTFPDEDFDDEGTLDHAVAKVLDHVGPGEQFGYTFDFGDDWIHECWLEDGRFDPVAEYGEMPVGPVVVFGWGTIPDQYGRLTDGSGDEGLLTLEPQVPLLHDEIERILFLNDNVPMATADIADTINAEGRYVKADGSPMTTSQVGARVSKYPRLFERTEDGRVRALRRLA